MNNHQRDIAKKRFNANLDALPEREQRVVQHFGDRRHISHDTNLEFEKKLTFGQRLADKEEIEHTMQYITTSNPTLTPALNKMWIDSWGRASNIALYRICPTIISGRQTLPPDETRGPADSNK